MGRAFKGQQKFAEAEPLRREALAIFREYYTPDHKSIQSVIEALKSVLQATGNRAGLEKLANEQAEKEIGSDSPAYHARLAGVLLNNESPSDAQKEEARRLIRRNIEEYGQAAADYPDNLDRRATALGDYTRLIKICVAAPGFTGGS